MSSSLLDLPVELLELTFECLDEKSLLAFRQVCKTTKHIAEATVLNFTESRVIDRLRLTEEYRGEIRVEFTFNGGSHLQSKLFFISAIEYSNISAFGYSYEELFKTMSRNDAASLFNRLNSLNGETKCNALEFYPSTTKMFALVSEFLQGTKIPELGFRHARQSEKFLLQLVNRFEATSTRVSIGEGISLSFLRNLAGIVDAIFIRDLSKFDNGSNGNICCSLIASEILRLRCSYLDVTESNLTFEAYRAGMVSAMIEYFTGNKPFYLAVRTSDNDLRTEMLSRSTVLNVMADSRTFDSNIIEIRDVSMARRKW